MNINDITADDIRHARSAILSLRTQAEEALAYHNAEVARLSDIINALTEDTPAVPAPVDSDAVDAAPAVVHDTTDYEIGDGRRHANGTISYPITDADGGKIGSIAGRGREWKAYIGRRKIGTASTKGSAINLIVEASA